MRTLVAGIVLATLLVCLAIANLLWIHTPGASGLLSLAALLVLWQVNRWRRAWVQELARIPVPERLCWHCEGDGWVDGRQCWFCVKGVPVSRGPDA